MRCAHSVAFGLRPNRPSQLSDLSDKLLARDGCRAALPERAVGPIDRLGISAQIAMDTFPLCDHDLVRIQADERSGRGRASPVPESERERSL